MQITKGYLLGTVGAIIIIGAGWWAYHTGPLTPPSSASTLDTTFVTSSTTTANTVPTKQINIVNDQSFPINTADTIVSWSFKGAYSGNESLTAQARSDIEHLTNLIGKGQYDDYDLYNGIANNYGMLGEGKTAYQNYNQAIKIHPKKGLAFVNLAHLMNGLGMYHTAADAYTKAVTVEPGMLEYHVERLTYLTRQFGTDNALITVAFAGAAKQFGEAAPILSIEAQWLAEEKRYAEALKVWERVKTLSFGKDTSAIDSEVIRLQAKI